MTEKLGRNEPCNCGSGKKYKQCCWKKDHTGPSKGFNASLFGGKAGALANILKGPLSQLASLKDRVTKMEKEPTPSQPENSKSDQSS